MGKKNTTLDLGINMNEIVQKAIETHISNNKDSVNSEIEKSVKANLEKLRPMQINIAGKAVSVLKDRVHKAFESALFLLNSEKQLYIYGPAGSGKTTLGSQLAKALDLSFSHISCSAGMSEAHLLGRMLFDGTYVISDFIRMYEEGGVFLFDEIDAADPNTLLVINSALANGCLSVPNRKDNPTAKRHKDFHCVVAGNTMGNGSVEYHGRNYLDAAFLDRFAVAKLSVEYDLDLEKEIMAKYKSQYGKLQEIRVNIKRCKMQRILSTRVFVSAMRQLTQGKKLREVVDVFMLDWSDEERNKALKDVAW